MTTISVIIPCYNYGRYIEQSINSVLPQMGEYDEIIVVDDGSTDDTREQLAAFNDSRVRYLYQDNAGVSAARNTGTALAANDYVYFLDADDICLAGGLDQLRELARTNPEAAMVFAGHQSNDDGRIRVHEQKLISTDNASNFIDYVINKRFSIANGGTALIRSEIAAQYPFPEQLKVSEDFCVYAWILANHRCASTPAAVMELRKHDSSLRHQVSLYEHSLERLPDILFDPQYLPEELLKYKDSFTCNRRLSLFRAQYLAGQYRAARKTYRNALQCHPSNILRWSYLRKYLRLLLK